MKRQFDTLASTLRVSPVSDCWARFVPIQRVTSTAKATPSTEIGSRRRARRVQNEVKGRGPPRSRMPRYERVARNPASTKKIVMRAKPPFTQPICACHAIMPSSASPRSPSRATLRDPLVRVPPFEKWFTGSGRGRRPSGEVGCGA